MPVDFSVKPTLTGERVQLRPLVDDDVAAFQLVLADPEVVRLTGSPPDRHFDAERLHAWYGSRNAQTDRLDLAVVDRASGDCVGEVVLYEWDPHNRSCTFRTLIGLGTTGKSRPPMRPLSPGQLLAPASGRLPFRDR